MQLTHYSPDLLLGLQEVESPRMSRESAHEGGKVVSLTHLPPLSPGGNHGNHFCLRLSRTQGHVAAGMINSRIPMTPSRIKFAIFLLAAPCLNQLRHCIPNELSVVMTATMLYYW
jgi:hypothetical protein